MAFFVSATENLKQTVLEELEGGLSEYLTGRYKNASILYSKAIFAMCDYLIASHKLKLPSDHGERFRILERYLPKVYTLIDRLFGKYTDTYLKPSDKNACEEIRNAVKELGKLERFDDEIEAVIGKI